MNIIYPLIIAGACIGVSARAASADSTAIFNNVQKVIVTESPSSVDIYIDHDTDTTLISYPAGDNSLRESHREFKLLRGRFADYEVSAGGFMLGFDYACNAPEGMHAEMGKSLEIGALELIGIHRRLPAGQSVSLGLGINWRNYRSTLGTVFQPVDGHIELTTMPDGCRGRFSRIKIFSLQVPVLYHKELGRVSGLTASLAIGPVFNFNPHGSVKTSWYDSDNNKVTDTSNNIGHRHFSIDIMAQMRVGVIGIYARYSPYKVLTGAAAPDFSSFSTGFTLFY